MDIEKLSISCSLDAWVLYGPSLVKKFPVKKLTLTDDAVIDIAALRACGALPMNEGGISIDLDGNTKMFGKHTPETGRDAIGIHMLNWARTVGK